MGQHASFLLEFSITRNPLAHNAGDKQVEA